MIELNNSPDIPIVARQSNRQSMTMNTTAQKIEAARARARAAEKRRRQSEITLAITRAKCAELQREAAQQRDRIAEQAVRHLFARKKIKTNFEAHEFKGKFLADPELIPLACGQVFNNRRRTT